jgi:ATP-dependent exoDNAse (exonuclease V) beta subunit
MTFGEVYHEIMQHLYTPYEGKLVHENDITTLKQDVYNDQYWAQLKPLEKLLGDELAEKVIRNCVYTTLEHDQKVVPFEYYKSELGTSRTLHIPSLQQDLSFFGKIDRVDVKSNHMRVIDYKTGSATLDYTSMPEIFGRSKNTEETEVVMRNEGNRYILQTLLYCWLLEEDKRAEALQEKHAHSLSMAPGIYSVRQLHDESKPTYLHRKEEEILYTADIAQEFVGELTELIEEIYNPDIPFYPTQDNRKCDGCYLSEICLLPQKKEDA